MSTNNSKVKSWLTVKDHWLSDTAASGSFNKDFARIKELGRQRTALDQLAGILHVQNVAACSRSQHVFNVQLTVKQQTIKLHIGIGLKKLKKLEKFTKKNISYKIYPNPCHIIYSHVQTIA